LTATSLHAAVAELGSERTVYRDLVVLQEAGFPIYQGDGGRWRLLEPTEGGAAIPIKPTELIALLLSEQVLDPLRGSELGEPLARLRAKLTATLGPRGIGYVERLRGSFLATLSAPAEYRGYRDELRIIERAIQEHRRLMIIHHAPHRSETLERHVDPYGLWYTDGTLYLIAFDHLREAMRQFLVNRIHHVEEQADRFIPDPGFDLQRYVGEGFRVWHGAVYSVTVEFAAEIAHLPGERRFHRSQRATALPDGRVRVTFEAAGLPDLASWVASFGGRLRVVEPPELVTMVRDLHRRGLALHEQQDGEEVSDGQSLTPDDNGA
jgi:predicted DNA-binding transcriptional regulator YafY